MAADHTRIEELRGRVQQDPASIAFAQLAEEYRRLGQLDEAVRLCRAGLAHHPAYISAHVTLGRSLMALGQDEEAQAEFEYVLRAAPDNLVALKSLEELRGRNVSPAPVTPDGPPGSVPDGPPDAQAADPVLTELEGWLADIRDDRAARTSANGTRTSANGT